MKYKKNILIILIVLVILIVIIMFVKNRYKKTLPLETEYEMETIVNETLRKVTVRNNYYTVKNIVEKYYYALCDLNKTNEDIQVYEYGNNWTESKNNQEETTEAKNRKKRIYNFFPEDYVQETGLSIDNLKDKLGNYNDLFILIDDMYVRDITDVLKVYFVNGTIVEKQTLETEKFSLMVATDSNNRTFNIYTSEYISKHNLYELSKKEDFEEKVFTITTIENRLYNKYQFEIINDETYASDLLEHYIETIKYSETGYSYNRLDKEYRENRFGNEAEYKEYIEENNKRLRTALLDYYKVDKYDDYTQYTCMDRKGNYYIFRESTIMDYSLFLDIYTVDLPEFVEKYNNATTEDKVKLNIEKIVEALNQKDYKYIYNKLVKEFKNNNFKNYEEFKKYAENTFDIENEVTYNKYTESENYCTYKITLKGKDKTITKTIVMKLEKGTDFIMSFDI